VLRSKGVDEGVLEVCAIGRLHTGEGTGGCLSLAARRAARRADEIAWEQDAHQHRDDRDDDKQFDNRERGDGPWATAASDL